MPHLHYGYFETFLKNLRIVPYARFTFYIMLLARGRGQQIKAFPFFLEAPILHQNDTSDGGDCAQGQDTRDVPLLLPEDHFVDLMVFVVIPHCTAAALFCCS